MRCPTPSLPASWKVELFTSNLVAGLIVSQIAGAFFEEHAYEIWVDIVTFITMWCLSFIMIGVGYEFTIDKTALGDYGKDYLVAMTAAGFPWMFVGLWYFLVMGIGINFDEALLIARFAAPTSAGILFSMLDAAGLKDTWVFHKARILAIFDDLDTIILMIPLKILMVGLKWELSVAIGIMFVLLMLSWFKLHSIKIPFAWNYTFLYAFVIAFVCKAVHYITHHYIEMEAIHVEVLLPAFVLGTVVDTPCARHELQLQRKLSAIRHSTRTLDLSSLASINEDQVHENEMQKANSVTPIKNYEDVNMLQDAANAKDQPPTIVVAVTGEMGRSLSPNGSQQSLNKPRPAWETGDWHGPDDVQPAFARDTTKGSKQSTLSPGSFNGNQVRKGSKQSAKSQSSNLSKSSKRSLSRYGHSKEDFIPLLKESPEPEAEPDIPQEAKSEADSEEGAPWEDIVQTGISVAFMLLVGMSMPALFGNNAEDNSGGLDGIVIVGHVFAVSVLMVCGKMFPILCYKDEATLKQRFALCLGMCPRGEVGASIIVISLELGITGPTIIVSLVCLALNLIMSGVFISMVKYLLRDCPHDGDEPVPVKVSSEPSSPSSDKVTAVVATPQIPVEAAKTQNLQDDLIVQDCQ